jgi:hypothetical protein
MLGNVLHDETAMAHSSILTEMLPEAGMNVLNGPRRRWGQNRAGSHERSASAALSDADGVILVMERPTLTAELERFCPYQQSIDHLRRYCAF